MVGKACAAGPPAPARRPRPAMRRSRAAACRRATAIHGPSSLTVNVVGVPVSAVELSPTHRLNGPGSTTNWPLFVVVAEVLRSERERDRLATVPAPSVTRWNPSSFSTGCRMLRVSSRAGRAARRRRPPTDPVFVIVRADRQRAVRPTRWSMTGAGSTARTSCTRARSRTGTPARSARRGTSTCTCCSGRTAGRSGARCTRSGSGRRSTGNDIGSLPLGIDLAEQDVGDRVAALGAGIPRLEQRRRVGAPASRIVSGRPFISTTTYGLPVFAIAWMSASCCPGRSELRARRGLAACPRPARRRPRPSRRRPAPRRPRRRSHRRRRCQ